ncbi:helix-turn-helix domain-containing protein [Sphingobium sp. 15-1]|uniref:helix-turn-helix domain-containing protein n=1 Tax=Sphingobium sp. 15-1 TaxID=2729616 RepID=UPI00159C71C0
MQWATQSLGVPLACPLIRNVWSLFNQHGRTVEEIASRLGVSRRAARRRIDSWNLYRLRVAHLFPGILAVLQHQVSVEAATRAALERR